MHKKGEHKFLIEEINFKSSKIIVLKEAYHVIYVA